MFEEYDLNELETLKRLMIKNNLDTTILDKYIEKRTGKSSKSKSKTENILSPVIKEH
ncbi:MAG: hypothetical protein ACTSYZ_14705 [Candidatus Helarchaeota archaeon]